MVIYSDGQLLHLTLMLKFDCSVQLRNWMFQQNFYFVLTIRNKTCSISLCVCDAAKIF